METTTQPNTIDISQLEGYVESIRHAPAMGAVTVHTRHRWEGGFAVHSRIDRLEQAGQEMDRTHHTLRTDWPEPFGDDSGPTPGAELLMGALGACVATTFAAQAARRGVAVKGLEVSVTGSVDLQGLFELGGIMPGFSEVEVMLYVDSEADDRAIRALAETTARTSPVFNSLAKPVGLRLDIETAG